jgi:hypothetical protein
MKIIPLLQNTENVLQDIRCKGKVSKSDGFMSENEIELCLTAHMMHKLLILLDVVG